MTSTTVPGPVERSVGFDSFDDMPDLPPVATINAQGIKFKGELTPDQFDAVRERIASRDDDDQAKRANLADLLASDSTASPLAQALTRYLLGLS